MIGVSSNYNLGVGDTKLKEVQILLAFEVYTKLVFRILDNCFYFPTHTQQIKSDVIYRKTRF